MVDLFNCFEQSAQKVIVLSLNKKRRGGKLGSLWGGEMEDPGIKVAIKAVLSLFHCITSLLFGPCRLSEFTLAGLTSHFIPREGVATHLLR